MSDFEGRWRREHTACSIAEYMPGRFRCVSGHDSRFVRFAQFDGLTMEDTQLDDSGLLPDEEDAIVDVRSGWTRRAD